LIATVGLLVIFVQLSTSRTNKRPIACFKHTGSRTARTRYLAQYLLTDCR
jgi:hypothetical protein